MNDFLLYTLHVHVIAYQSFSGHKFGLMIGNRLMDDRKDECCNKWQPLADPLDPKSEPLHINISRITGSKCVVFCIIYALFFLLDKRTKRYMYIECVYTPYCFTD